MILEMNPEAVREEKEVADQEAGEDVELVRAIAHGDTAAFHRLYERHSSLLHSLAFRILEDASDAEDVLQEVFVQVWRRASTFDARRARPVGWLVMLTRSRAIDRFRSRAARVRATETASREEPDSPSLPDSAVAAEETHAVVREALDALPAEQKTALKLAYFGGLTQSQIASRFGLPLGTVKTRMRNGLIRMREHLVQLPTEQYAL